MKNKFLLLSAAILFAFTPMHAGAAKAEVISKATRSSQNTAKAVSLDQVQQYMAGFGIQIVGMSTITGSEDVYARDNKGITYIVYVTDSITKDFEVIDY